MVLLCKKTNKLIKLAKKHGIFERLILPGFQANPYNWIANAQLKILSSAYEGLGMVLIEALVCGTPVVSTQCDFGPDEILTGELSDFLSPVWDAQALANNINKALNSNLDIEQTEILKQVEPNFVVEQYLSLC